MLSNIRPSWIEDEPKALKMLEKNKFYVSLEEWQKSLKNKYKVIV